MATYTKFDQFCLDLINGAHQLATHALNTMLVNSPAPVFTNSIKADLTEVANGGGYTTGGILVTGLGTSKAGTNPATSKLLTTFNPVWTGSAPSGFTFRYAVLFNNTQTTPAKPLIAFWDYGTSQTVAVGETLTVDYDDSAGILQVT